MSYRDLIDMNPMTWESLWVHDANADDTHGPFAESYELLQVYDGAGENEAHSTWHPALVAAAR